MDNRSLYRKAKYVLLAMSGLTGGTMCECALRDSLQDATLLAIEGWTQSLWDTVLPSGGCLINPLGSFVTHYITGGRIFDWPCWPWV